MRPVDQLRTVAGGTGGALAQSLTLSPTDTLTAGEGVVTLLTTSSVVVALLQELHKKFTTHARKLSSIFSSTRESIKMPKGYRGTNSLGLPDLEQDLKEKKGKKTPNLDSHVQSSHVKFSTLQNNYVSRLNTQAGRDHQSLPCQRWVNRDEEEEEIKGRRLPLALSHSDCEIEFVHGLAINFLVSPESAAHGGGGGAATVYGRPGCRPEDFSSIYLFFFCLTAHESRLGVSCTYWREDTELQ